GTWPAAWPPPGAGGRPYTRRWRTWWRSALPQQEGALGPRCMAGPAARRSGSVMPAGTCGSGYQRGVWASNRMLVRLRPSDIGMRGRGAWPEKGELEVRPVDAAGKMEPILVALDQILAARRRIAPYLEPTPLQASRTFSRMTGWQVWLKPENLQRTGSFKARGALNAVLRLAEGEGETGGPQAPSRRRGVITASSGNHGQAVAFAAASAGLPATVVVPEQASPAKVAAMEGYGARVVRHGRFPDERK